MPDLRQEQLREQQGFYDTGWQGELARGKEQRGNLQTNLDFLAQTNLLKSGDKVLEIGPGRGAFADLCLERSIQYTAIEPNPHLAESLESRGAEVVRALVPPLPEMITISFIRLFL